MKPVYILRTLFLIVAIFVSKSSVCSDEIVIPVSPDADISVERYPGSGKYLMLMLAPEYGFRETHRSLAQMLAGEKIEVWLSNIPESLFLTQSTGSLKQLDGEHVAKVIDYAHKTTGKKIVVAGDSYASVLALRGAHQWQKKKQTSAYLIGAILFSPYTYSYVPPLGMPPEYMPIVSATNIPLMIYQAEKSGTISQFQYLLEKLQQHGNAVYSKYVPAVMSLFYEVPPTVAMKNNLRSLPRNISKMIPLLEKHKLPPEPIPINLSIKNKSGIDITLREFKGNSTPIAIKLKDIEGKAVTKTDFKGKLTLINFWATWCAPCIEEIPSLNRLKNKMKGLPFELISINYAESRDTIQAFMKEVKVEFPVLLDRNGELAKKYNVIVYPSTFVIDTQGKIKYGVNAAIEWDDPELIKILKSLM